MKFLREMWIRNARLDFRRDKTRRDETTQHNPAQHSGAQHNTTKDRVLLIAEQGGCFKLVVTRSAVERRGPSAARC